MTEFIRTAHVIPAYDYRDDPDLKQRNKGTCTARMAFIVRGPLGAISAHLFTGWQHRPLLEPFLDQKFLWDKETPFKRANRPGMDNSGSNGPRELTGAGVASHSLTKDRDYWSGGEPCPWLDDQPCWGDIGFSISEEFVDILVGQGSDKAYEWLETVIYPAWLDAEASE